MELRQIPVLGQTAFDPRFTAEYLYRAAQEAAAVPDMQEALEDFAHTLLEIQALPETAR